MTPIEMLMPELQTEMDRIAQDKGHTTGFVLGYMHCLTLIKKFIKDDDSVMNKLLLLLESQEKMMESFMFQQKILASLIPDVKEAI